jgi:predicted nucleic acid-binding protein
MARYMLHTAVAQDLILGRSITLDRRIAATRPKELCISAITRGELLCGVSFVDSRIGPAEPQLHASQPSIDQTALKTLRKTVHADLASAPHLAQVLRKRFAVESRSEPGQHVPDPQFSDSHADPHNFVARVVDQFLVRVECLSWGEEAATQFARIAKCLSFASAPLSSLDIMIAAHALALEAILVTNVERLFENVRGLKVENWARG